MKTKSVFQVFLALTLMAGMCWSATPAAAAGIIVNSLADTLVNDGVCTLREAIINADSDSQAGSIDCPAGGGSDTIIFNLSGSIILGASLPPIISPAGLVIDGIMQSITIDGNGQVQIFTVMPLASLALQNLSVINGAAPGANGGGALNFGILNVVNCTFTKNSASQGGGIFNAKDPGAFLMVVNSTFNFNSATTAGGGIYNASQMNVQYSTFDGNLGGDGGGIYSAYYEMGMPVMVDSSTFINNKAGVAGPPNLGGGINNQGQMNIVNSTFTANSAMQGGGIYDFGLPQLNIINSTLTADSALMGGEIFSAFMIIPPSVQNTIFANSLTGGECSGPVQNGGNNIDSGATCRFGILNGSLSSTNPLLGAMTGLPAYFPLTPPSPAIDLVTWNAPNGCPAVDQRGQARPQDGNGDGLIFCDTGSYEYVMPPSAFQKVGPANGAVNVSTTPTLSWGASTNAVSYDYCYDTSNNSACDTAWVSTGGNTSIGLAGLNTSTTYYWQARANNGGGSTEADGGTWWSFTTVPPVPGAFGKSAPIDLTINVSTSPTLSWGASSGAASYDYCYDTLSNSTCDTAWIPVGNVTSIGLVGLNTSTIYYWQIRANNAGGITEADGGTWWTFTTVPPLPGAFGKTSPSNGAINVSTSPTLTWGASSNAASYDYCYDTVPGSTCEGVWTSTGSGASVGLSGLNASTTYYWQARANNVSGSTEADGGTWWSFTTVPPLPGAFGKSNPTNTATNVATALTLSWGSSSGAASYDYCYDTVPGITCEGTWTSTGSSTSVGLVGLNNSTTYYWQARANNAGGTTEADGGTWWYFTTVPPTPGVFGKSAPADTAANISISPTLLWGASASASSYDYCYDMVAGGTCEGTWISTGSSTSVGLSGLAASTTYYWQVRANNVSGTVEANSGTWWSFTTAAAPGAFSKSMPANGTTWVPLTKTLKWASSSGATSYSYCYDTSNNNACNTAWVSTGTSTSGVVSGLAKNTMYYWQVRASGLGGKTQANGGTWWSFKTFQPVTYYSLGAQDGWILESGENTNTGGTMNPSSGVLILGDNAQKMQYRSVLSYYTAGLPNNAVITKVTLKLKHVSVVPAGMNPITLLQGMFVDVRNGFFGTSPNLQLTDFGLAAHKTVGPYSPALSAGWYTVDLSNTSYPFINKLTTNGGLTQFRLRFKLDDNNNAIANMLNLVSGNDPTIANRPSLIVECYVP